MDYRCTLDILFKRAPYSKKKFERIRNRPRDLETCTTELNLGRDVSSGFRTADTSRSDTSCLHSLHQVILGRPSPVALTPSAQNIRHRRSQHFMSAARAIGGRQGHTGRSQFDVSMPIFCEVSCGKIF